MTAPRPAPDASPAPGPASPGPSEVPASGPPNGPEEIEAIRDALRGLRYGQVVIIVQDGVIIQIERMERRRMRLNRPDGRPRP